MSQFSRTELLIGPEGVQRLRAARVAVFGIGGVGSYVVEALARCGVGTLDLIDHDTVAESNINRQLIALHSTIGRQKVEVARERIFDINPSAIVNTYSCFLSEQNAEDFPYPQYDYIVDAVDTVTSKLLLIKAASEAEVPIISCMGVGNKLYPEMLSITDITKTTVCPLAKVMRRELKERGIKHCRVLYSTETPIICRGDVEIRDAKAKRQTPGSISFVPSVAGLMIAGEVLRALIDTDANI